MNTGALEGNNFRRRLRNPLCFLRILFKLPRFLYLRGQVKKNAGRKAMVPGGETKGSGKLFLDRLPLFDNSGVDDGRCLQIELAATNLGADDIIDWSRQFEDIEDTFALNRFGWLLTEMHVRPSRLLARRAVEWIGAWIDEMGDRKDHPSWESYSVAERLSNWPFILSAASSFEKLDGHVWEKFASAVEDHLDRLSANRELNGPFTNNHILNDARGLYIGAIATGNNGMCEEAQGLFREWIPNLIDDRGVLKEDSSHYQLLICQRVEQVLMLARQAGDDGFASFLQPWLEKMTRAAQAFYVYGNNGQWSIPLIGDVSPDFPPEWLSPLSDRGWLAIRNRYHWEGVSKQDGQSYADGTIRDINERFFRYNSEGATIFWHIPNGPSRPGSHSHFDIGSFVFFLNGIEVLADPGRHSYEKEGIKMASASAHTGVAIDGLGPFCEDPRLNLADAYPHQRSHVTRAIDGNGRPLITIDVGGFKRLADSVGWTRSFTLERDRMIISDSFRARDPHELKTRFILAAGAVVEETEAGLCITSPAGTVTLGILEDKGRGRRFSLVKTPVSPRYGRCDDGTACVVDDFITGDCTRAYEVRWGL